ncbi:MULTISPECIES: hypothetical protein [unclassified Bradyrhizobium]|nr:MULTISPECIES: hypothetical protein [unclassified Bradyrhizobium]
MSAPQNDSVIAGLDPAIHPFKNTFVSVMDARVKPAHDGRNKRSHG